MTTKEVEMFPYSKRDYSFRYIANDAVIIMEGKRRGQCMIETCTTIPTVPRDYYNISQRIARWITRWILRKPIPIDIRETQRSKRVTKITD